MHDGIMEKLLAGFGPDGVRDLLYRSVRAAGREAAEQQAADASAIGRNIMRIEELFDIRGRIIEQTPDRFVREVTECPWSMLRPLSCRFYAWWMEGFVEGLNQEFGYRLEKLIPKGDSTCIWRVDRITGGAPDLDASAQPRRQS